MVFQGVTRLKGQELGNFLFQYINLEDVHILCRGFTEDFQINYHGPKNKLGNKNVIVTQLGEKGNNRCFDS